MHHKASMIIEEDSPSTFATASAATVSYPKHVNEAAAAPSEPTVSFSSSSHPQAHPANSNGSSSSSSTNRPTYFPIWLRLTRLIFGKIKHLPKSMSTTLVLFTVHMYLTVPVLVCAGIRPFRQSLLRPFRQIKEQGFLFEELGEQFCELL